MRYSLDLSNPWIPQYVQNCEDCDSKQNFRAIRDAYKVWLAQNNEDLTTLFSTSRDLDFLHKFG